MSGGLDSVNGVSSGATGVSLGHFQLS
jgi:hypothetical protein